MKVEIDDDVQTMSVTEVVDQLRNCGAIELDDCERLGEARLECGCDLEVDVMYTNTDDPRIEGSISHTETFTASDIRDWFTNADWCEWARTEDGEDILLCFGAC